MALRRSPVHGRFAWFALVIAGLLGVAHFNGWLPREGAESRQSGPVNGGSKRSGGADSRTSRKSGTWEEMRGCTLVEDRGNDGDSFVVRHKGIDHTMRIYFADCPEKQRHQFNGARLAEQGRYFGGLTEAETVEIGEEARDFTRQLLRSGPFTVLTRWEQVFDSGRFYAFVNVAQGDLAELLVGKGLARIYTKGADRPGGWAVAAEKQHLQKWEREAKRLKEGAWAQR